MEGIGHEHLVCLLIGRRSRTAAVVRGKGEMQERRSVILPEVRAEVLIETLEDATSLEVQVVVQIENKNAIWCMLAGIFLPTSRLPLYRLLLNLLSPP